MGSTQGFSRGLAQILVWTLLKRMGVGSSRLPKEGDWFYLSRLLKYLDENKEMVKLRKKAMNFFTLLDVDNACSVEGILGVTFDENENPVPVSLVETIKKVMKDMFDEASFFRGGGTFSGGVQEELDSVMHGGGGEGGSYQRKIIPFDVLNMSASSHAKKPTLNAAGSAKLDVVICASLIDKPTNLGGLSRTCEIFGCKKLVVPNKTVVKMDNFKSVSVSSHEWIDIEECPEKVRFDVMDEWLGWWMVVFLFLR